MGVHKAVDECDATVFRIVKSALTRHRAEDLVIIMAWAAAEFAVLLSVKMALLAVAVGVFMAFISYIAVRERRLVVWLPSGGTASFDSTVPAEVMLRAVSDYMRNSVH